MKGRFGFSILKELKLVLIKIENDYTLDDIMLFKQKQLSGPQFETNFKSLYDLTNSNYVGTFEQINEFVEWVVTNNEVYNAKNSSFITATPKQLVISKMITGTDKLKNNKYGDHSTIEGSLRFLNIKLTNLELVNSELNQMVTTEL